MLETGQMAPDFTLPDQDGQPFTLSSLRGGYVVLYFYPKDNTSGCTKEACSLNGELDAFSGLGARVVGVSADGSESHQRFIARYSLGFTLLSDGDHEVMKRIRREDDVRKEDRRSHPLHLPHRPGRQNRQDMEKSEHRNPWPGCQGGA